MTTSAGTTTPTRQPMSPLSKTALAAGILYLLTFVTSIPALGLYDDVVNDPDFVLGAGSESTALWAAFLELFAGLTIGTAVVLSGSSDVTASQRPWDSWPARTLEAGIIFVGALSLLSIVTLRYLGSTAVLFMVLAVEPPACSSVPFSCRCGCAGLQVSARRTFRRHPSNARASRAWSRHCGPDGSSSP